MAHPERFYILCVDDDLPVQKIIERALTATKLVAVRMPGEIWNRSIAHKPDFILLGLLMLGMDGYEFRATLQKNKETACIPVKFLTSLEREKNRAKTSSVGATTR